MPSVPASPKPSKAGIVETPEGERKIPASVRPDGSTRKSIKIRPGYRPPEDVEVYKNNFVKSFINRGSGGVPGATGLKDDEQTGTSSVASNKNAKRREARKKAKAADDGDATREKGTEDITTGTNSAKEMWRKVEEERGGAEVIDEEAEKEKKARNLKKKLKQAKELKEKKDGGSALLPEQFAKVIKINELVRELAALGFNSEGESNPAEGNEKPVEAENDTEDVL